MAVRGTVKNGKVVLNDPKALPEGIEVEVRPARKVKALAKPSPKPSKTATRSLADRLAKVVGTATTRTVNQNTGPYYTIQSAVNATVVGDTVLVMPAIHSARISTELVEVLGGATVLGVFLGLSWPADSIRSG